MEISRHLVPDSMSVSKGRENIKEGKVWHKVYPLRFLGTDYTDYTDYTDFL